MRRVLQSGSIARALFPVMCLLLAEVAEAGAESSGQPWLDGCTLLLLDKGADPLAASRAVRESGGDTAVILPPRVLAGWIPPERDAALLPVIHDAQDLSRGSTPRHTELATGNASTSSAAAGYTLSPQLLADSSGVGSATSAPFTLYLGPGLTLPTGSGVGSEVSLAFALYLGPGLTLPTGSGVGSGVSLAFALYLGRLRESFALSPPFEINTRSMPQVTMPNGGQIWTPGWRTISWDLVGLPPHHWAISYSTGGPYYRTIDSDYSTTGPPFVYLWKAPPIGTTHLRIKVESKGADGSTLNSDQSDADNVLHNLTGVAFEYRRYSNPAPPSEPRAALLWDDRGASSYLVEFVHDPTSSCSNQPSPRDYGVSYSAALGRAPWYFEIPSPDWEDMVVGRWTATIRALDAGGQPIGADQTQVFIKCRLGDLDPYDDENKVPVILVHGWMSNSDTWFENGQSPLRDGMTGAASSAEKRHPWTFEYPNIESIQWSGAGLGEAIEYVKSLSGHTSLMLVAHSMGGLVCRTYLQGQAIRPATGDQYPAFRSDVTRLATLGSPHLGEPYTGTAAFISDPGCDGVGRSQSFRDLDEDGTLVTTLAQTVLPASVEYYLAAGTDYPSALREPLEFGSLRHKILRDICGYGNDATVDVCSARGGDCEGLHENRQLSFGSATVVRANYHLAHGYLSKPGIPNDNSKRGRESRQLLNDVLGFLRCGSCLVTASCPPYDPTSVEIFIRLVEGSTASLSTTPNPQAPSASRASIGEAPSRFSAGTRVSPMSTAIGAEVMIQSAEATDPAEGFSLVTDLEGIAAVELPEGDYRVQVRGGGIVPRSEILSLGATATNLQWNLDVLRDTAYQGPSSPQLSINGRATATADSVVTLALGCVGATEYQVSEGADFATSTWEPLTPTTTMILHGGPGRKFVLVKYRDGIGRESSIASASIVVMPRAWGRISVGSSPPGASIILDSQHTGRLTPAEFDSLASGYHYVSLSAPGTLVSPALAVVRVDSGATAPVEFTLVSSNPPSSVDLSSLGSGEFIQLSPLRWSRSVDPDPGDVVFYDAVVARDSALSEVVWSRLGIADTSVTVAPALPDSVLYYVSIQAIDGHGIAQVAAPGVRSFLLDRTPPDVALLAPAASDTLSAGNWATIVSEVTDWGGVDRFVALLSSDAGQTFPDTLYEGVWVDSLLYQVPVDLYSNRCAIQLRASDRAGNVGVATSDTNLTVIGVVSSVDEAAAPRSFAFSLGRGNPFGSTVRFTYAVPTPSRVRISVFDVRGRLVRRLIDQLQPVGRFEVTWNGHDAAGHQVASGVYFALMDAPSFTKTRRLVLIR